MRLALAACALVSLALPAGASGHAAFVGSVPAPGARVEVAPERIVVTFTEPLNRKLSRASLTEVTSGRSVAVDAGSPVRDRVVLRPRSRLARGAYRVRWHTVSTEDGHALEGSFSFGVRVAAAGSAQALEESPLARDGWVRVLARLLLYVALLLLTGALVVRVLLGEMWRSSLTRDLGLAAGAAAALAAVVEAADAAGGLSPDGLRDFLLVNVAGGGRVAVVVLAVLAAVCASAVPRLALLLVVLALGALAASGHAGSAEPRVAAIVNDWVHLVAGGAWLGGLGMVVLAARERGEALRRFGAIALPAFAVVVLTGLVSLVIQLGGLSDLWETAYGRVLAVKIVLVGVVALLAALRMRGFEPVVGLAVVAGAALLVTFPLPPRQLDQAGDALAAAPACDPCPLPPVGVDELGVAEQAGPYVVAGWLRRAGGGIEGEVRVLDRRGRAGPSPSVVGVRGRNCGGGCVAFSGVRDSVRVRVGGFEAVLPSEWQRAGKEELRAVERRMRSLRSVRSVEETSSGPGTSARVSYWLSAPNRMRWESARGVRSVVIGSRQWLRTPDAGWVAGQYGDGLPFSLERYFRWSSFGASIARLGPRELALADTSTPVWHRLTLDARGRVVRERIVARARFIDERFFAFDRPVRIVAP